MATEEAKAISKDAEVMLKEGNKRQQRSQRNVIFVMQLATLSETVRIKTSNTFDLSQYNGHITVVIVQY